MKFTFQTLISLLPGVVSGAALLTMHSYPNLVVFFGVLAVWWLFIVWSNFFFKLKHMHLFLRLATSFAFVALLALVEWQPLIWLLVVLSIFTSSFIWRWVTEISRRSSGVRYKTWRRIITMVWVFDVYAGVTALFALPLFFQGLPRIIMALIAGAFAAGVATIIWHVYFHIEIKVFGMWAALIGLVVVELMWALFYLPLGYFGLSLFLTWLWYLVQLFVRFHLTKGGIIWLKQRTFLAVNAIAFASILLLVRWV